MKKPGRIIARGPFNGNRIECAPTDELDMFRSLAEAFMEEIFSMEPGSYLITDESSLWDFQVNACVSAENFSSTTMI